MNNLAYLLKNSWSWPVRFLLRPLDVIDRIHVKDQSEGFLRMLPFRWQTFF
ncbi:MAG: hypothetical protein PVG22_00960 [Chromatiales bacterium]|jgi:hypothetical protein